MRNVQCGIFGLVMMFGVACDGGSDTGNPCIDNNPRNGALDADNADAASYTEAQCAEAGNPCESDEFIGRAAAECIAREDGLEPGIEPWSAGVVYHYGYDRPIWNVDNLLEQEDDGCRSGKAVSIDAITGEVLASSATHSWGSCP